MNSLGTMALEESSRVDFARLRRERLERVLAEMERRNLDALLLGRGANIRYVAGARSLWIATTRPFSPACVVVRSTRQVHLLSVWDEGVPPEIPRQNLYLLSWNPMNLIGSVKEIPGLGAAKRVGVDGMGPLFAQLLPMAIGGAAIVDGEAAMRAARLTKTPDEIACIRTAAAIAESALDAAIGALRPGVRERELLAAFEQRMTDFGVSTPAMEGVFCVTPRTGAADGRPPLRQLVTDLTVNTGDLVAFSSGVLYAGYEGGLGRTWPCGGADAVTGAQRDLARRWRTLRDRLLAACRPGATGADLRAAYEASGEPLPPFPLAHGVGMGYEPPVVGTGLGADFDRSTSLQPGMVLALQGYAWSEGTGGYLGKDMVLVTESGPELLTSFGYGPLAD